MRKFLFTAQVIALVAFVPAVLFAYLHDRSTQENEASETEVVHTTSISRLDENILHFIRVY